jgi:hypothetical protein
MVLEGVSETGRDLANFLMRLPIGGFPGFHDQVSHTQLLDERHYLLPGSSANRKHGDNCRDSENHAQHGEQRAQPVGQKILQALTKVGHPLLIRLDAAGTGRWHSSRH